MAVTIIGSPTTNSQTSPDTTFTVSHTVVNETDCLVASFKHGSTISSVTYNGVSMTQGATHSGAANAHVYIYYLITPPIGTFNFVSTVSNGGNGAARSATLYNLKGVNQVNPIDQTTSQAQGTGVISMSLTTARKNTLLIGAMQSLSDSTTGNHNADNTNAVQDFDAASAVGGSEYEAVFSHTPTTTAGSYTVSFANSANPGAGVAVGFATGNADFLCVAGGGGGGANIGGGGGAGGMRTGSLDINATVTITVGDGGAGSNTTNDRGVNGSNSSIASLIVATGGGGGGAGNLNRTGAAGGSGGGAGVGTDEAGGAGTSGQGNAGGTSGASGTGGGGGAGAVGANGSSGTGGAGGAGLSSSITGSAVTRSGGGGGGRNTPGAGGAGGGGAGASSGDGTNGTPNTGGGGGGCTGTGADNGGSGGSGIVIIAYPTGTLSATGGTISFSGGNTIHTFTATSSFMPRKRQSIGGGEPFAV